MDHQPLVSIIVITMNTPHLTSACLRAVGRNSSVPYELIVVNNSRARAIRKCLGAFPGIRVLQNPRNLGFARAANLGALASKGKYLCFLNTDTLVPPRWLERLVGAAQAPKAGAVGPASQSGRNILFRGRTRHGAPVREAMAALADEAVQLRDGNTLEAVSRLFGYCLLIPRVVMARVGLFDENYFFGMEDEDYSVRLRRQGYRLLRVRSLFVHHQGRASSHPQRRGRWVLSSRAYFRKKWGTTVSHAGRRVRHNPAPSPWRAGGTAVSSSSPGRLAVTVMMAAHNTERWIREAIESVLDQGYRGFELIVADDGSTDHTLQAIQPFLRHPQVRLLQNTRQMGIAATRNRILREARGRYIAVCDSDDVVLPTLLKRFVPLLEEAPRIGWVYADRLKIDAEGLPLGISLAEPADGRTKFRRNIFAHAGALIRRGELERAGGYDERLTTSEDYDTALKIARRCRMLALPGEIHYLWRRHPGSASTLSPWRGPDTRLLLRRARGPAR